MVVVVVLVVLLLVAVVVVVVAIVVVVVVVVPLARELAMVKAKWDSGFSLVRLCTDRY